MPNTFTPSIGPAKGIEITISDRMQDAIENRNTAEMTELTENIEAAVAQHGHPNGQIELFKSNPTSQQITHDFINSSWGTKQLVDLQPSLQEFLLQKATEHPDIVQDIIEDAIEREIEDKIEFAQFLLEQANKHPEEVQTIIDLITNF